jgi:hypothetical protein
MIKDLEEFLEHDKNLKEKIYFKNSLENYIFLMKVLLKIKIN